MTSLWRRGADLARRLPRIAPQPASTRPRTYGEDFIEFIAAFRGTTTVQAAELIERSQQLFAGGWAGNEFREFTGRALEALRPLHGDASVMELISTYQVHAPFDFLRMLSYPIPTDTDLSPIIDHLGRLGRNIAIVDYGCGLAHRTIAVACALRRGGVRVDLTLVDIHRGHHTDFLTFLGQKYGLNQTFVEITSDRLYPDLPAHDYADLVNVLEHLPDPVRVVDNIDRALRPGGLLLAGVGDQADEMMHVTPQLGAVRDRLAHLGYAANLDRWDATLFTKAGRKPA
jgi:SAM-dependent methyltransferase